MNGPKNSNILKIALLLSIVAHGLILTVQKKPMISMDKISSHIPRIRIVGEDQGVRQKLIYVKQKKNQKKSQSKKPSLKDLSFAEPPMQEKIAKKEKPNETKRSKELNISKKAIKRFLKASNAGALSASRALRTLSDPLNDVSIKLEVPKGIKEDELNKHELVFYSFQKRTVLAYINSFHKELNSFEKSNPHLRFPLTTKKQKLAGRVIYDKNGDILKIETLRWSKITKLQNFFMDVLKNMNSLPNPPKEILEGEKFAINFVLSLNN